MTVEFVSICKCKPHMGTEHRGGTHLSIILFLSVGPTLGFCLQNNGI